jgi:hypothetical protein
MLFVLFSYSFNMRGSVTIYVSASGDDANDGVTPSEPAKT